MGQIADRFNSRSHDIAATLDAFSQFNAASMIRSEERQERIDALRDRLGTITSRAHGQAKTMTFEHARDGYIRELAANGQPAVVIDGSAHHSPLTGKIVDDFRGFHVQEIGRMKYALHSKQDLPDAKLGQNLQITYNNKQARSIDLSKEQTTQQNLSQGLGR